MSVTGDFGKLDKTIAAMLEVASKETHRKVMRNLSEESLSLVKEGFAKSTAPDGSAWAPLKRRKGMPLRDTGRLNNSFRVMSKSDGSFTVGTDVEYAKYHQQGVDSSKPITRVNAHGKNGKFISREKAGKQSKGSVRVSISTQAGIHIPARKMVPEGELPPKYAAAFLEVAEEILGKQLK